VAVEQKNSVFGRPIPEYQTLQRFKIGKQRELLPVFAVKRVKMAPKIIRLPFNDVVVPV
jgi:hypothetical protein